MKDATILQDCSESLLAGLITPVPSHDRLPVPLTEIYLAVQNSIHRSQVVDALVLDGFDASPFASAAELWERFQTRPVRFVITEQDFGTGFTGLDLSRSIRKRFLSPYVFIVMLSSMSQIEDVEEGLASGVDDYLIKPPHPRQLRTRALIGARWLQFIDRVAASLSPGSH